MSGSWDVDRRLREAGTSVPCPNPHHGPGKSRPPSTDCSLVATQFYLEKQRFTYLLLLLQLKNSTSLVRRNKEKRLTVQYT